MSAWMSRPRDVVRFSWLTLFALFLFALLAAPALAQRGRHGASGAGAAAGRVTVMPVFFVPSDEAAPTPAEAHLLMQHMRIAQARYKEMLGQGITFALASDTPAVYRSKRKLAHYLGEDRIVARFASELLPYFGVDRNTCPYVFAVVLMNPHKDVPRGFGRPMNGSFNKGGGGLAIAVFNLDSMPNFQGTLQHELGHAFGLPHVEAYGYDMHTNASIMAYNHSHHYKGFQPSATPGTLIPEDRRGLALNQRVFPGLKFDPGKDVPAGYKLAKLTGLGAMDLDFTSRKPHRAEEKEPGN